MDAHPDNLARLNLTSPSMARLESWARRFRPSMARSSPTTLARLSGPTPLTITATSRPHGAGHRNVIVAATQSAPVASVLARQIRRCAEAAPRAARLAPPERAGCETGASTRTASREASCESPARRRSWRGYRTKSGVPAASPAQTPPRRRIKWSRSSRRGQPDQRRHAPASRLAAGRVEALRVGVGAKVAAIDRADAG